MLPSVPVAASTHEMQNLDTEAVTRQLVAQRAGAYQVYEQTPALICILRGPDYVMDYHNPAFQQLYAGRQMLGRTVAETQPEAVTQGFVALLDQIYNTGETYQANEVLGMVQGPDGGAPQERYFDFTYQPFQENGQTVGISVFAFEVTEQVLVRQQEARSQAQLRFVTLNLARANEKLAAHNLALVTSNGEATAANRVLVRTNADLDTFVYAASHDLKTPIANIEGLLEVLDETLRADPLDRAAVPPLLAMMHESVARFQQTIHNLGHLAALEQELLRNVESVDLATVIDGVKRDLAPLLLATGGQVEVDVAACPALTLAPKNVRSIIYNLLSNALKYRDPARPPRVRISCQPGPETCVLRVQDNGLGLTPDQVPRLFGLFQRLHSHVEGSGIGLYMIRKIVENAGGTIAVESQLGEGTTFTVTLPG